MPNFKSPMLWTLVVRVGALTACAVASDKDRHKASGPRGDTLLSRTEPHTARAASNELYEAVVALSRSIDRGTDAHHGLGTAGSLPTELTARRVVNIAGIAG